MSSFNVVNYSIRPNKCIQRSLIFEGYKTIQNRLGLNKVNYIGLGSIWFSDFVMAHKTLHIDKMVSIESSEIGYRRAEFNKPFKSVSVVNELSTDAIRTLCADKGFSAHPWLVWLDYDGTLNETVVDDMRLIIERAPQNTALVVTFSADSRKYGKPKDWPGRFKAVLGDVVPDELTREDCDRGKFPEIAADLALDYMKSAAASVRRPGGLFPCFRVVYRDGADMVTVGGVLPSIGSLPVIREAREEKAWPSWPKLAVATPPLTIREIAVLQAELPRRTKLTRASIRKLGFDLEESQIEAYEKFYKYYPAYAQIST